MIDVSVITPAWNAARTITRAMKSALSQTGVAVEVIVADDASTDATGSVVAAVQDDRVRYLRLPVNGGPAAARNAAIRLAQGRWIAVLDADDMMLPGRLMGLVQAAMQHRLDIVTDNMWIEDSTGRRRLFVQEPLDGEIQRLGLAPYVASNRLFGAQPGEGYLKPLFSAAFLQHHALHYDVATRIGEDFLLVAEAMAFGASYGRRRDAGYVYTTAAGSISHRLTRRDADAMVAADRRYLARHASRLDAAEQAAWAGHLRSLQDGAGFVAMVDGIKARDLGAVVQSAWRHPRAMRHFSMPIRARIDRLVTRRPRQVAAQ